MYTKLLTIIAICASIILPTHSVVIKSNLKALASAQDVSTVNLSDKLPATITSLSINSCSGGSVIVNVGDGTKSTLEWKTSFGSAVNYEVVVEGSTVSLYSVGKFTSSSATSVTDQLIFTIPSNSLESFSSSSVESWVNGDVLKGSNNVIFQNSGSSNIYVSALKKQTGIVLNLETSGSANTIFESLGSAVSEIKTKISGSGNSGISGISSASNIGISQAGSGSICLGFQDDSGFTLDLNQAGSGNVYLTSSGTSSSTSSAKINQAGSGNADLCPYPFKEAAINQMGSASLSISASTITGYSMGSGSINYKGTQANNKVSGGDVSYIDSCAVSESDCGTYSDEAQISATTQVTSFNGKYDKATGYTCNSQGSFSF